MSSLNLRTASHLIFLAITMTTASAAAGGPIAAPRAVERRAVEKGVPNTAPPPEVGWPHAISTATGYGISSCNRTPAANEVVIYSLINFGGTCAVMTAGFYPYGQNLTVGDDAISSIKVGSGVRARVFLDPVYSGNWNIYAANTNSAGLGAYDNKISSIRIEPATRSETCGDLREGEIALFRNQYGTGDCVVLPGAGSPAPSYANAESMGIANDSISSIKNNSALTMTIFWDPNFTRGAQDIAPHTNLNALATNTWDTTGIDDNTSSVMMH